MILSYHKAGKEATMHTQTATTLVTEAGDLYVIECDVCGPLGIAENAWDFMLDHVKEMAQ